MTVFRFIHSSDLHLGRHFGSIPQPADGNIRGRLMEARHGAIARLATAARDHGAGHVLLAGDTFDTPTPSPTVLQQALAAMGEAAELTWWLLPGNHDNLREAEPLWDAVREGPGNVRGLTAAEPVDMAPGATLLPCPVEWRSAGRDPSAPLAEMPSDEGSLRIGLAHGGITDFTESGDSIPPDRDRTARLDYLGLGDWHGRMEVSPRVQYSGTPEQDRFKHGRRGVCLAVTVPGPGASPQVSEIETGAFLWAEQELPLSPRQDTAAALEVLLPSTGRRDTLLHIDVTGWTGLPEQADLARAAGQVGPDFAHFELLTRHLGTHYERADLDEIDRAGALRLAAERLLEEAEDEGRSAADRAIAGDALSRLYAYAKDAAR